MQAEESGRFSKKGRKARVLIDGRELQIRTPPAADVGEAPAPTVTVSNG